MYNIKDYSREELENNLKNRNVNINIDQLYDLYEKKKSLQQEIESLNSQSNQFAKEKNFESGKEIKHKIKDIKIEFDEINEKLNSMLNIIPNMLHESVPIGIDSNDNQEIKRKGEIIFEKHHYEMDIFIHCADFIGSRFNILKDPIAKLERALASFMMDFLEQNDFTEISSPFMMNSNGLRNSDHLPKDENNMFKIENEDKYLIPTGEPLLVNLGLNQRWNEEKRFCILSDCFRKEAGAAGQDTRGLIRVHQFKKCEMVCFSQPNASYQTLEKMLEISCEILNQLEIPWRVLLLCSGDSPFTSAKTYDIEIPIGNKWREVASISNCTNFQSNNINCKNSKGEYLHILNGSALAVGRTLASLLEVNYNNGKITIPKALHKYLSFKEINL